MRKKTIALDFDGVLHSYEQGWTGSLPEDLPVVGALSFVQDLLAAGFKLVIFSRRAIEEGGTKGIQEWLVKYGFPQIPVEHVKPNADLYLDDRGFRFEGNWDAVRAFISHNPSFSTWNRIRHKGKA